MQGGKKRQQGRRSLKPPGKRTSTRGHPPGLAGQPALVLQAVLDSVDDALLLVDTQGSVEWANSRFLQWMGIEPHEWPGLASEERLVRRLAGQFRHPERFGASRKSWRGEHAVWDELELVKPAPRILERLVRPVFGGAGEAIGWLHVYRDITAGRLIHSKMLQTERMAALGQLVSGIAHELNNPLTSILGYAQMARTREAGAAGGEESSAERIFQEAQRVQRIVRNLLVFARDARPERAPLQLNSVVERTLALRSYELQVKNVTVHLALDAGLPRILGDAHQLQQVVLNLVVNAEQAIEACSPRGAGAAGGLGHIAISTGRAGKNRVTLEVCDDGLGIPREVALRIFDPFFTTKPVGQGTGLGLSITYGIVREHAGEISVSDAPRTLAALRGAAQWRTSFLVELPIGPPLGAELPPAAEAQQAAPESAEAKDGKPPNVLVVEDEQTVARLIRDVLENEGMSVEVAIGGQAGLRRLLAPANGAGYDLVICDLKMPGLDGASLYRELQTRNHPAKDRMLFMTGDTLSRRTLEFIEQYKKPFLSKPFLADELREAVRRCLKSAAGASPVEPRQN